MDKVAFVDEISPHKKKEPCNNIFVCVACPLAGDAKLRNIYVDLAFLV